LALYFWLVGGAQTIVRNWQLATIPHRGIGIQFEIHKNHITVELSGVPLSGQCLGVVHC